MSLKKLESAAVAFSAGTDSAFLLKTANKALGGNVLALTARSAVFPQSELDEAAAFCKSEGIRHVFVDIDVINVPGFAENPPDRCYICKKALFSRLKKCAEEFGMGTVLEGSNADDVKDYRPGMKAVKELGIKSPLIELGLTKDEIRLLSKDDGLSTWNKPSSPCLATRIAYGESITREKVLMVEKAELKLKELGFPKLRVRLRGKGAVIEVPSSDFSRMLDGETRENIVSYFSDLGFFYTSLDLAGFKSGSMNKELFQKTVFTSS